MQLDVRNDSLAKRDERPFIARFLNDDRVRAALPVPRFRPLPVADPQRDDDLVRARPVEVAGGDAR